MAGIDIPGRNSFDLGKKEKNFHQPFSSGTDILQNERNDHNVPMRTTLALAYRVDKEPVTIVERECRRYAAQKFPDVKVYASLATLVDDYGLPRAQDIATKVAKYVMSRWCECNGTFAQRKTLANPANWTRLLGLHPDFILQFQDILRDTEQSATEAWPWVAGPESICCKWVHGQYDPNILQLENSHIMSVLRESDSPFDFAPSADNLRDLDEELTAEDAKDQEVYLRTTFQFLTYDARTARAGAFFANSLVTGMPMRVQMMVDGVCWEIQNVTGMRVEPPYNCICSDEEVRAYSVVPKKPKNSEMAACQAIIKKIQGGQSLMLGKRRRVDPSTCADQKTPQVQQAHKKAEDNAIRLRISAANENARLGRGQPGGAPQFVASPAFSVRDVRALIAAANAKNAERREQDPAGSGKEPKGP